MVPSPSFFLAFCVSYCPKLFLSSSLGQLRDRVVVVGRVSILYCSVAFEMYFGKCRRRCWGLASSIRIFKAALTSIRVLNDHRARYCVLHVPSVAPPFWLRLKCCRSALSSWQENRRRLFWCYIRRSVGHVRPRSQPKAWLISLGTLRDESAQLTGCSYQICEF